MSENQDQVADEMIAELEMAESVFRPGIFWTELNRKNGIMLAEEGLSNFKRTVSQNYFNWLITDRNHPLFKHAFSQWLRRPNLLPLLTRLGDTDYLRTTSGDHRIELSPAQRLTYRLYVAFVWSIMTRLDRNHLRKRVSEPTAGNPFRITSGRTLLSQDLATSILECNVLVDLTKGVASPRIAELGAGYGRVAHTYVTATGGKYVIFDIPPALAVAQWYMEQTFGSDRIFRFRHFERFEEVRSALEAASVVLCTPNQMRLFPDKYFDVTLSISSLPEMRPDQVELFVAEMQRLSSSHVFLKQFKHWRNAADGTELMADSYNFGSEWSMTLDRTDPIIFDFFNRVWTRHNAPVT